MRSKLLLFVIALAMVCACKKPDGKLSGVVTYYFNENYGDKPDVGAKIYIMSSADIDSSKIAAIEKYSDAKFWMTLIEHTQYFMSSDSNRISDYNDNLRSPYFKSRKDYYEKEIAEAQKNLADYQKEIETNWECLKKLGINNQAEYDKISETASSQLMHFQLAKGSKSFTADGSGSYSTNLPPGKYYVLIVSNHRRGHSIAEILGQIVFNREKVESDKETTSNAKFSID